MFNPDALGGATDIRIRVEVIPHLPDDQHPIRLRLLAHGDVELTELKFTPARARDTAYPIARLLSQFMPTTDSHKLAEGLRAAAVKVWATRN